ncbi:MAG: hypothetical protein ACKO7B_03685 [Flavobacteriales bacterium]
MKMYRLLLAAACALIVANAHAAWDIYKSGIAVNGGYYDCQLDGVSPNFQNNYFGRYTNTGSLTINSAEMLTYKNGSSNACGGNLKYRIYRTCDAAPAFSTLALTFCCNQGGSDCSGGACGPDVNNAGDQKWRGAPASALNLITGLTLPGTYIIEVYFEATGSTSNSSGCEETKYSSNGGANFKAYFEFETNDGFSDSDFSTPTWSGDVANFSIAANSTTSGLLGSEGNRTFTPKLNVASGSGSQYISTQIATWDQQQEWYFWVGRDGVGGAPSDLDANNQQAIYLYANESNLESATVDGYRILLGQTGTSFIRLQRIDNGVATTVFTSGTGIPTALTDYGVSFKITRTQTGLWTIYTSTLPTNSTTTQSTPTPNSCPEDLSTVNHGTVTENTYAPAANGYFGFMAIHDNTAEGRAAAEFDSFRFRALPPDTYVAFSGTLTGQSVQENATLAGNYAITLSIVNPSSTAATSVQIAMTGDATRVGAGPNPSTAYGPSYATQTVTWSAGETATKTVYIDPDNNSACDDIASLIFRLQNANGGTNAYVGAADTLYLDVVDDDKGYETLLDQDFNSGSLTGWKTNGTAWSANTTSPIEGSYSARHSTQGVAGQSSLTYPIDDANLVGLTTTWRFEVAFANDASANNNFQIFLAANDTNLYSAAVDGYAVVIDQSSLPSAGTADYIRLYRVTDGVYGSTPIVNSSIDWVDNVNAGTRVGFQVTLGESGTWGLSVDNNGGFDNLSSLGTGTDATGGAITFPIVKNFGVRFKYLAAASDLFRIDDISVTQSGCKRLWYSQATGNSSDAIWAATTNGTGQLVVSSRYDRFVVQNSHTVTSTGAWLVNDITVSTGATLLGGTSELRVHGNWIRQTGSTFTPGTSTVVFKGQQAQDVGFESGAATTSFYNLTIDNDGYNVSLTPSMVTVTGLVSMLEGTLQTNGNLRLISNSTGSASIGEIKSGASVSGNVELQRFTPSIPNSNGAWFNLACPILGQTIQDWNDDVVTTGFPGSDYPSYGFNNVQYYNESAPGTMGSGYVPATNVTNSLNSNNRGYYVWLGGATQNLDNTGLIQSGQVSVPLSYTVTTPGGIFDYGWNLVGNPYPSEVDWNLVSASLTGPKVYYVYDYQSNTYKFRNATTNTGTASRYIAHSQGFMVKVNAAGQNLVFQETHKTNTGAAFERSEDADDSFVALRLSKGQLSDESMIVFDNNATVNYDERDVADLQSPAETAVEMTLQSADGAPLAQDARPFAAELEIPVLVDMPEAGDYLFTVVDIQNMPLGACLTVEDVLTGEVMTLSQGAVIPVHTNEPFQGVRLVIRAVAPAQTTVTGASCNGLADASIDVVVPSGDWNISLSAEEGYEFMSQGSVTFDHLLAGQYLLQVEHPVCGISSRLIEVSEPQEIRTIVSGIDAVECNIGNSGMFTFEVENAHWFNYELLNAQQEVVRTANIEGTQALIESLPADLYTLRVYTPCSQEEIEVDLRDALANSVVVEENVVAMTDDQYSVELNAYSAQPGAIEWTLSNGETYSGNAVQLVIAQDEVISYTVNCLGVCGASAQGSVQALNLSAYDSRSESKLTFAQSATNVSVQFAGVPSQLVDARLYDAQGRMLECSSFVMNDGMRREWSTQQLSAGAYTLVISSGSQAVLTQKFIK